MSPNLAAAQGGRRRCPRRARALRRRRRGRRRDARGPGRPLDARPRLVPRRAARQARCRADRDAAGRRDAGSRARRTSPSSMRCSATCSSPPATRRPPPTPTTRALALVPAHAPSLAGEGRLAVGAGDLDDGDRAVPARRRHPAAARVRHRPGRCPGGGRPDRRGGTQRQARPRRDPAVPGQRGRSSTSISPCSRPTTATRPPRSTFAKAGYAATPTVRAADALAWALHRLGRDDGGQEAVRRGAPARLARPAAPLSRRRDRGGPRRRRRRARATSTWRSRPTPASPRPAPPRPAGSSPRCPTEPPPERRFIQRPPAVRISDDSTDGGRDPFSCTGPRGASGRSETRHTSAGRDCLVYTIEGRRRRRRPPHRGDIRRRVSSHPATGRRRSSRAIPPPTTRTCTRSSARTTPNSLTIIANYVPLEEPAGGPNFFPFDPAVRYEINIDNNGDGKADVTLQLPVQDATARPKNFAGIPTFLYNDGPITSLTDPNLLVRQTYDV